MFLFGKYSFSVSGGVLHTLGHFKDQKSVLNLFGGFVVFVRYLYFQKPLVAE